MTYTQVNGNRPARIAVIVVAVAVLVLAALGGGYLLGHNTSTGAASSAVVVPAVLGQAVVPASKSGPARIVGGIPSGYSDDRDGAISAALGFFSAVDLINVGGTPAASVRAQMVSANPSAAVLAHLIDGLQFEKAGVASASVDQPIAVKVLSITPAAAQLSFWSCTSSGNANTAGQPVTAFTSCFVENVALSWERGDWKTADYQAVSARNSSMTLTTLVHDQGYHVLAGAFTVLAVGQP